MNKRDPINLATTQTVNALRFLDRARNKEDVDGSSNKPTWQKNITYARNNLKGALDVLESLDPFPESCLVGNWVKPKKKRKTRK